MALPRHSLPTKEITVAGDAMTIRAMSRSEALKMKTEFENDPDGAENWVLSCGCDVSLEDASEWRGSTDIATAGEAIEAILILSGLMPEPDPN